MPRSTRTLWLKRHRELHTSVETTNAAAFGTRATAVKGTPPTAITDAGGYYVFGALGDGRYEVQAQAGAEPHPAGQVQIGRTHALNVNFGQ